MTTTLATRIIESPVGRLRLAATDEALRVLTWTDDAPDDAVPHPVLDDVERQLREYFAGERTAFDVPREMIGTPFQCQAWEALTTIPYGQVVTYAEQAERVGRPKAARAIGSANGSNPIAIIVPCHRVVASNGLGGFGGGLKAKRLLLELEAGVARLAPDA